MRGREDLALFHQVRRSPDGDFGVPLRDAFDAVRVDGPFVVLGGLTAGDYRFGFRRHGREMLIRVVRGERRGGIVAGPGRWVVADRNAPLSVQEIRRAGETIRVALANAANGTRVHVVASRYEPAFDWFESQSVVNTSDDTSIGQRSFDETTYAVGRTLSDEYRYILERRQARRFPGNMLERPGVLLNPWELEETNTAIGLGGGSGGAYGGRGGLRGGGGAGPPRPPRVASDGRACDTWS